MSESDDMALAMDSPEWSALAEATLMMYTDAFRSDNPDIVERGNKALQVWNLLCDLGLALPPAWVAAVWHATDIAQADA